VTKNIAVSFNFDKLFGHSSELATRQSFREYAESLGASMEMDIEENTFCKSVCNYVHSFCNGVYTRHMIIPKGIYIVGYIHRQDHTSIISRGKILIRCENDGAKLLDATDSPLVFVSPRGTRRIVLALEDTYWTTIHSTNAANIEDAEKELFETYYDKFLIDFPEFKIDVLEEIAA